MPNIYAMSSEQEALARKTMEAVSEQSAGEDMLKDGILFLHTHTHIVTHPI